MPLPATNWGSFSRPTAPAPTRPDNTQTRAPLPTTNWGAYSRPPAPAPSSAPRQPMNLGKWAVQPPTPRPEVRQEPASPTGFGMGSTGPRRSWGERGAPAAAAAPGGAPQNDRSMRDARSGFGQRGDRLGLTDGGDRGDRWGQDRAGPSRWGVQGSGPPRRDGQPGQMRDLFRNSPAAPNSFGRDRNDRPQGPRSGDSSSAMAPHLQHDRSLGGREGRNGAAQFAPTGGEAGGDEAQDAAVDDGEFDEFSRRGRGKWEKPSSGRREAGGEFAISRGREKGGKGLSAKAQAIQAQEEEWARRREENAKARARKAELESQERRVVIPSSVTVSRLASIFDVKLFRLQTKMNRLKMTEDQRRPDYILTTEEACDIALEFGFNPTVDDESTFDILPELEEPGVEYPLRPPVVTIMGHVDHGKTTLLDSLRNTAVAAGEAGGITQHIGAFSVPLKSLQGSDAPDTGATITFLDTPGHAAFTGMRARGASVTDIVVLVVAADDGVMPQTKEVLDLVKDEGDGVGLVIAINKIDKPGVDVDKVKTALGSVGVHLEEDGGDTQSVRVSGLSKIGLDNLVETLSTLAELRDIRARREGKAEGLVLESHVDKGKGRLATVLVQRGVLRIGSVLVAGQTWCRVRTMSDDKGRSVTSAGPGAPVVITGWRETPSAGDELLEAVNGEHDARKAVANRITAAESKKMAADAEIINEKRRDERLKAEEHETSVQEVKASGGNVFEAKIAMAKKAAEDARRRSEEYKELRLVIKGDVSGTVEAVEGALTGIGNKEAGVKIISTGVGEISEWDVTLAEAAEALIIGFNVPASRQIKQAAKAQNVDLHLEGVIYRLIETVRAKTAALLPKQTQSRVIGEATVSQIFEINVKGRKMIKIAGCKAGNGTINKNDSVRVMRGEDRAIIYEGKIQTLKHVKKDVMEIRKGMECGLQVEGFEDFKQGDEIVTFQTFEVQREL